MDSRICIWDLDPSPTRFNQRIGSKSNLLLHSSPALTSTPAKIESPDGTWQIQSCIDLDGHQGSITSVKWIETAIHSPKLISSSYDGTLRIWDPSKKEATSTLSIDTDLPAAVFTPSQVIQARGSGLLGFTLTPNSSHAATWTRDGRCAVLDLTTGRTVTSPIRAHRGPVTSTHFMDASGRTIASAGLTDGAIKYFDLRIPESRGRCVGRVENLHGTGGITCMVDLKADSSDGITVGTLGGAGDGEMVISSLCGSTGGSAVRIIERVCVREQIASHLKSTPSASGVAAPIPASYVPYSLLPLHSPSSTRRHPWCPADGIAISWGNGTVSLHTPSNDNTPEEFSLKVRHLGDSNIRNAMRDLKYLRLSQHKLNDNLPSWLSENVEPPQQNLLLGVGDDGMIAVLSQGKTFTLPSPQLFNNALIPLDFTPYTYSPST
ncbi:hypothetical protein HDU97_002128 [Phlyctochytrium planicorne]|nr:hypothetical protein HDU97_002128 [Phlyctochytrium planicorne]